MTEEELALLDAFSGLMDDIRSLITERNQLRRERDTDIRLLNLQVQQVSKLRNALSAIAADYHHDRHSVLAEEVLDGR